MRRLGRRIIPETTALESHHQNPAPILNAADNRVDCSRAPAGDLDGNWPDFAPRGWRECHEICFSVLQTFLPPTCGCSFSARRLQFKSDLNVVQHLQSYSNIKIRHLTTPQFCPTTCENYQSVLSNTCAGAAAACGGGSSFPSCGMTSYHGRDVTSSRRAVTSASLPWLTQWRHCSTDQRCFPLPSRG